MEQQKKDTNDQELMRSMKVSKAVAAMAIPSVISSLVTVVYNMADTFFVGQTGDALQVAAVSLTNPIFIIHGICQYVWYGRKRSGIYGHGRGKAAESKKYYGFYYICQPDCRCWGSSAFIGVYVACPENFWRKWGNLSIC